MDLNAGFLAILAASFALGALHALEPGHGKTIMGAFLVASRGGVRHAMLLGLVVTITHTAIVFLLAAGALYFTGKFREGDVAFWLGIISAALVIVVGAWMCLQAFGVLKGSQGHSHSGPDGHSPSHGHGHEEVRRIATDHGLIELSIFEDGVPPRFQVRFPGNTAPSPTNTLTVETTRDDGARQLFKFENKRDYLESTSDIPEPHQFSVTLALTHEGHAHTYATRFVEHAHHEEHSQDADHHDHDHEAVHGHSHEVKIPEGKDPLGFWTLTAVGASGGLVPCPAALTAFLAALNLGQPAKGIGVVVALSLGIATTLITIGIVFVKARDWASRRYSAKGWLSKLPRLSAALITLIGVGMLVMALRPHHHWGTP
jgi:nickel/cobalt exporter